MAKASRPCRVLGCPHLHPCPTHKPKPWAASTARARTTTPAWRRLRTAALHRDGHRCTNCGRPAHTADHILPVAEGGTDTLDNLQSLCDPCHKAKTAREAARGRARARQARGGGAP